MPGTFTNYMELNTLRQKRQNRITYNLAWSCQWIRFSSAPLNLDDPWLFHLPYQGWGNHNEKLQSSLHEIYRERLYHQVAGTWNRQWWAVWFPHFFSIWPWNLYYEVQANTSKGVMTNEHLTLSPSRAFMNDSNIFVPFRIVANSLLQIYYDLFTWARMKAKPKKSRSLSLVGGSARENHSKLEEVIRSQQSGRSW